MANALSQFLLAAAVAAVVGGTAVAQETALQEAVRLLRLNKGEEAVAKLREILASDPSSAEALALYQSVKQDEWFMLMTEQGDVQKIAQSILERAKVERRQRSRDEAAIRPLVDAATAAGADHLARQQAINKLIADHGEFAVPALVEKLGNADDAEGQIQAIYALSQLHSVAVLPLIEALKSSNELVVRNAAAALSHIGDDRAAPAMVHVTKDARPAVAEIARRFAAKKNTKGTDVELLLAAARGYLKGNVPAGGFSEVVWRLVDDKLVPTDVPALLYPVELAKASAGDAVRVAPASLEARSVLAQANLAQANLIEASIAQGDESLKALAPVAADLKIAALASGPQSLRAALDAGVQEGMVPVAVGACQALAASETAETIGSSALIGALKSTDKRIKYAAAEALVRATGGVGVPAADQVVAVLADAVAEEAVRTIQVIDPSQESAAAVQASSSVRGLAVDASADAVRGMRSLLVNPNVDVVVINEILPDRLPEDVIGNIKKDARMANTRVVVIAKDQEAAKARFGDSISGTVQAPLTGEALVQAVNTVLEGVVTAGNARAEAYAKGASEALLTIASNKGRIDGAVDSLAKQLNRADAVAVPAARSVGLVGSAAHLDALLGALTGGGSVELKSAAAEAIGNVLSRMNDCPSNVFAALGGVVQSDADVAVRTAAAVAMGKAKIGDAEKAQLLNRLERIAGGTASSEG
jgi:HEAT repeat protein